MSAPPNKPPETVSPEEARRAEPVVRAADPLALEEMRNSHQATLLSIQRGWIGIALGTGPEKSGNVATLTIFACFVLIILLFLKTDMGTQFDQFYKMLTTLLAPVGLALGYLFGSRDAR